LSQALDISPFNQVVCFRFKAGIDKPEKTLNFAAAMGTERSTVRKANAQLAADPQQVMR
jgi:hypothetical protein